MKKIFKIVTTVFFIFLFSFFTYILFISKLDAFSIVLVLISFFLFMLLYTGMIEEINKVFKEEDCQSQK